MFFSVLVVKSTGVVLVKSVQLCQRTTVELLISAKAAKHEEWYQK